MDKDQSRNLPRCTLRVKFFIGMWLFTNRKNSTLSGYLTGNCPDGIVVKNLPANAVEQRHRFNPWVRKMSWSSEWQLTQVFLLEKSQGERNLIGYLLSK